MDNRELQSEEGSLLPEEAFDATIDPRESSGDQDAAAEDEEAEDADVMEIEVEQVDVDDSPLRVAVGRRSRMEKDPLGIGVPFPVFRVVATEATPSPISPVARLPSTVSETSLEDDSASGKVNDRHQHVIRGGNVAVGIPSQDQDAISADVKAQLAQLDATIARMAAGVDVGPHGSESFGRRLSMQERCSIPGGYAIGGPGLNANEQREASVTVPGEDVDRESPLHRRQQRSASLCLSTTGESLSSNYSSSNLEQSSASNILVEATLVAEENTDNLHIVYAEAKPLHRFNLSRSFLLCMALLFIFLISVVVVVTLIVQNHGDDADSMRRQAGKITQAPTAETFGRPTLPDVPTLQRIKETGAVRCGKVSEVSNFLVQVGGSPPKGGTRAQSEEVFKGANAFTDNFVSKMNQCCILNSSNMHTFLLNASGTKRFLCLLVAIFHNISVLQSQLLFLAIVLVTKSYLDLKRISIKRSVWVKLISCFQDNQKVCNKTSLKEIQEKAFPIAYRTYTVALDSLVSPSLWSVLTRIERPLVTAHK